MLYILSGPDDFSLNQSLNEIIREIGDPAILVASTTTLDAQEVTLENLRTTCETAPFLAEKRLVIIKGLLERFEPQPRASRQPQTTKIKPPAEFKSLSACLSKLPDSTVVILIESRVTTNNNPLFKELAGKAVVKTFPLLKGVPLRQWVQKRVAQEGGSISSPAVDLLLKFVGSNLWIQANEISKLVLFASGRPIEAEDVRMLVSYAQEADVFAMVDAIIEFKASVAEPLLQRLLQWGASPAYLLFMLSRQLRLIVRAGALRKEGKPKAEVQQRLGLSSEFALRKTLDQAEKYSLARLREVYYRLLETDLSIKTGKYDGELALNLLVAELGQQGEALLDAPSSNQTKISRLRTF